MTNPLYPFRRITIKTLVLILLFSIVLSTPMAAFGMSGDLSNNLNLNSPKIATPGIKRIAGSDRYETALLVADELKTELGISKFDNVVIASGQSFSDALSGSYLATIKKAPIILISNSAAANKVYQWLRTNLNKKGTIYILGGTGVVSGAVELSLKSICPNIKRLSGSNRYETNLKILREAAGNAPYSEMLICSGKNFPDALSASATGKPILLVSDELSDGQKDFLGGELCSINKAHISGGTGAVSDSLMMELTDYSVPIRLSGKDRYSTAIKVANTFFEKPSQMVMATGLNFPDSLSGGVLAHAKGCPMILSANTPKFIGAYHYGFKNKGIKRATILGGSTLVSNDCTGITTKGAKKKGLLTIGTDKYYAYDDGSIAKNRIVTIDSKKYYAGSDWKFAKNTIVQYKGKWYGATESGVLAKKGWVKIGNLTYYIKDYEVDSVCIKAKKVLDKVGHTLWDAYVWSADMPYYRFNNKTSWGIRWFANFGFSKEYGDCIVMASTFWVMAKMLGYNAIQVDGVVNIGHLPHSWVYIQHEDGRFLYDPNCLNETGSVTFKAVENDGNNTWWYHPGYKGMKYEP